jgi:gamma-tubulin complex component 3
MSLGRTHLPEHLLLRDCLYLLQGISGKYVRFQQKRTDEQEMDVIFVEESVCSLS